MTDTQPLNGACHCGTIRFRVRLKSGLDSARRCNCTYCRMRGAVAVATTQAGFEILSGADNLTLYQFNTRAAEHFFCSTCGIYTHHRRRSNPDEIGVNVACLEGMSPFDFPEVLVLDGINHPSDNDGRSRVAGRLRYVAEGK